MKDLGIMRCQGIRAPLYIDVTYAEPFLSHTKRMDSSNPPGCFFHNTQALSHSLSLREMYRLFLQLICVIQSHHPLIALYFSSELKTIRIKTFDYFDPDKDTVIRLRRLSRPGLEDER